MGARRQSAIIPTEQAAAGAGSGDALTTDPLSQFAATTSAELAGVISDETGSGALVFGTSPTLTTPVLAGAAQLSENAGIRLDAALSADGKWSSIEEVAGTAGAALAFGELCYLASTGKWLLADADAAATAGDVMLGFCVLAAAADTDPTVIQLRGNLRADGLFDTFTVGVPLYVGLTPGTITATKPSATDDVVRRVGWAITADSIRVDISPDYLTAT